MTELEKLQAQVETQQKEIEELKKKIDLLWCDTSTHIGYKL